MLTGIKIPLSAPTTTLKENLDEATAHVKKYAVDVDAYSKKAVESQAGQIEKLRALKTAYGEAATAARKGSDEQVAALKLQADASKRLAVAQGEAVARSREMGSSLGGAGKAASEAGGRFQSLGSHVMGMAKMFLGAAGIFGAAEMFKAGIDGAESYNAKLRQVDQALRTTGASVDAFSPKIKGMADAGAKLGYTNTEILTGFQQLTLITHSAADAYHYMGLAEDLSRAKGISLQAAALAVGKAIDGKTTALQRYGIVVKKGEPVEQALAQAQKTYEGQALAGTTATQKLHASLANMEEHVGQALLPTFSKLMDKMSEWFSKAQNQEKITRLVKTAIDDLKHAIDETLPVIEDLWRKGESVVTTLGGWKNTLKDVLAIWIAWKITPYISDMLTFGKAVGEAAFAVGTKLVQALGFAKDAEVSVEMANPFTAIAAAVGLAAAYTITHWTQVKGWFEEFWKYTKALFNAGKAAVIDAVKELVWVVLQDVTLGIRGVLEVASHLPFVGGAAKSALHAIDDAINTFKPDWSNVAKAFQVGGSNAGTTFGQNFVTAAQAQMNGLSVPSGGSVNADAAAKGAHGLAMSGATGGGRYDGSQIYRLLLNAGFTPGQAQNFVGIAMAESGGQSAVLNAAGHSSTSLGFAPGYQAYSPTGDYSAGLFQENFYQGLGPSRASRYESKFGLKGMDPTQFVQWLRQHPAAQAQIAHDLFASSGYSPWMGDSYVKSHPELLGAPHDTSGGITPSSALTYGSTTTPKKAHHHKAPAYKIPQELEARIRLAQEAFKNDVTKSHLATLDVLLEQEHELLTKHGLLAKAASVENEITSGELKLKKAIEAAHKKLILAQQKAAAAAATLAISRITAEATGPDAVLKLAQAAHAPDEEILKDQQSVLAAYQDEARKLSERLRTSSGQAHSKYAAALARVEQSVRSAQDQIVQTLDSLAKTAQGRLTTLLQTVQTAADAALGNQYFQNGLKTPTEALLESMRAQDTQTGLQNTLDKANDQLAKDQAAQANAETLANDQQAIDQAKRQIEENNLQIQATAERTKADKDYAQAQYNLNAKLASLVQNVGDGSSTMADLNGVLGQFGIHLSDLADPGGNGLLSQLNAQVAATIDAFKKLNDAAGTQAGAPSAPGGASSPGAPDDRSPSGSPAVTYGGGAQGSSGMAASASAKVAAARPGGTSRNGGQGVYSIHALGGAGTVFTPHVFLAGDNGPEDYYFMPHGRASIGHAGAEPAQPLVVQFTGPVYADSAGIQRLTEQVYAELLKKKKRTGNLSLS